ncbi:8-oxo-dGTP diphosphatase MutT [soil metagenome]
MPRAERVVVTAAVVERDGAFLVTRRLEGTHLAGFWEFPGGKCEPGESYQECLEREMREELDTGVRVGEEIVTVEHEYADRIVELHFFRCVLTAEPRALLGQEMRWVPRAELRRLEFPPADAALLELLNG